MSPGMMRSRSDPMPAGARIRMACGALLLCLGCVAGGTGQAPGGPPRPAGVPGEAFWSGGADGGVFILLERRAQDPPHVYRARIYYDHSGDLWYDGRLALEPADGPAIETGRPDLFGGWDGESLYLKAGGALKAIDPVPAAGGTAP